MNSYYGFILTITLCTVGGIYMVYDSWVQDDEFELYFGLIVIVLSVGVLSALG